MEPDDDLIRRALGADRVEEPPPAEIVDRAIALGTMRRRRRLAAIGGVTAMAVVVAGAAALTRDGSDSIVVVAPSSAASTVGPITASPTTMAPMSVTPSSTSPLSPTTTTTSTSTSAPTTTVLAPAPTITSPSEPPCDPAPQLTVDAVVLSVVGVAPARGDAVLAQRFVGYRAAGIDLWSADGLAATLVDTVADNPDQWYCPTALVPLEYDGRYLWAAVDGTASCRTCPAPLRSRLFRADVTTGEVTEAWSAAADGEQVLGILPSPDGSVSVLSGPASGSTGSIRWLPAGEEAWTGERSWTLDAPLVDAAVSVAGVDPLVRPYVVYTTGGHFQSPTVLHVVVIGETDQHVAIDLSGTLLDPVIGGVSPDGSGVLLVEDWEGLGGVTLVRLDSAGTGRPAFDSIGSAGCWTDSGLVARSTWSFSSESTYSSPGTVELVDPADLSVQADLGLDTYGGDLACLTADRVGLTAHDGIPADVGRPASIVPGSQRLVVVGRDTLVELPPDPDLWVAGRNAND